MSAATEPFVVPIGESLLRESPARVRFTAGITAALVGGPAGWVEGRLFLTEWTLAFRPPRGMPHPQRLTVDVAALRDVRAGGPRWLGLLGGARGLHATLAWQGRTFPLVFEVDDPAAWARAIRDAAGAGAPRPAAEERIDRAIAAGITDRARYLAALSELSFSVDYLHVEVLDDLERTWARRFAELGLDLPEGFVARLAGTLDPDAFWGVDGSEEEEAAGRAQLERVVDAVNAALPEDAPRRLYRFAPDLPGWPEGAPLVLALTAERRDALVRAGVLREP